MNETINLSPRQKAIINSLGDGNKYLRIAIANKIASLFPVSKATIARDLSELVKLHLLSTAGNGPSTTYQLSFSHSLLKPIDLDLYFEDKLEENRKPNTFNDQIYPILTGIFDSTEQESLKSHSFSAATKSLTKTIVDRELERFIIELSWKSSKIEGNTYSLLETETLIKHSLEAEGKTKIEANMILNHKAAFKVIQNHPEDFQQLQLSTVLQLHQALTQNLGVDTGIRSHAVGITGSMYRPLDNQWQLQEQLIKLIDRINATDYPLEKALITLAMIAYLQPFSDGNKRTARMLSNALLLAHDYFPLSYRSINIEEYKKALILFYETNNLYHLKRLFLEQYQFSIENYFV